MNGKRPETFVYGISFLVGFVTSLAISLITGKKEPWDSGLYFTVGIPVMSALMFFVAYTWPEKPWRWVLAMAIGQATGILNFGADFSLWPLTIVAMIVCSAPQFGAVLVASLIKKR